MNRGYFLAEVAPDGSSGKLVGDEDRGAVMVFDELTPELWALAEELGREAGAEMGVFQMSISVVGRVHRT